MIFLSPLSFSGQFDKQGLKLWQLRLQMDTFQEVFIFYSIKAS